MATCNVLNHDCLDTPLLGFTRIVTGYARRVLRIRRRQQLQAYRLSDSPNCLEARGLDPPGPLHGSDRLCSKRAFKQKCACIQISIKRLTLYLVLQIARRLGGYCRCDKYPGYFTEWKTNPNGMG